MVGLPTEDFTNSLRRNIKVIFQRFFPAVIFDAVMCGRKAWYDIDEYLANQRAKKACGVFLLKDKKSEFYANFELIKTIIKQSQIICDMRTIPAGLIRV